MKNQKNEQVFNNLLKATDEFKDAFDTLLNNIMPLKPYEDERLELKQKYLAGMIFGLIELVSRHHDLIAQYHEKIKDYSPNLLNKMLNAEQKEVIFAVGEKVFLSEKIDDNQDVKSKKLKM